MSNRKTRPIRPSVLGWITLLLVTSAMLRLGAVADVAQALGDDAQETRQTDAEPDTSTASSSALLEAFRLREERVEAREALAAEQEEALALASTEIEERLTAMQEAEESLAAMISLSESAAENDLRRLTAVYENMRPQEAASLFENMDPAFSAGFLGLMDPAAAAGIMGRLTPEVAYSISAVLAGRNSMAPRQ